MQSDTAVMVCIIIAAVCIVLALLLKIFRSPFSFPYFEYEFDVSGKRDPQIDDYLDMFLMSGGFEDIQTHQNTVEQWKIDSCNRIERSILKNHRRKQYEQALENKAAFMFRFFRIQTRYRQKNYVKMPYKIKVTEGPFEYDYDYIKDRYGQLADIGFECTLRAYHSKNQRKLATRELRELIMQRDNFTCQICGKHMPDEVGLQIDHIVPVSKGGKTIPSNLRVLCSKCNGSKSDKMPIYDIKSRNNRRISITR